MKISNNIIYRIDYSQNQGSEKKIENEGHLKKN